MSLPAPKDDDRPSGVRGKTLGEFMAEKPKRPRYEKPAARDARVLGETDEMRRTGDWGEADGHHLVALYGFFHQEVYGVEALELDGKSRAIAARLAEGATNRYFGGDFGACVSFMLWVWRREQGREEWRRANQREGTRIGWKWQWSAQLVTDYRVDGERKSTK